MAANVAVALVWATVSSLFAQQRFRVEPFDEAASVRALLAARAALVEAIQRHDVPGVRRFLASDFNANQGGPEGALAAFQQSPLFFRDLVTVLAFGGGFVNVEKTRFCAPFWYARPVQAMPYPHDLQPPEGSPFWVVLANVPVFEKPDRQSSIIGHVGLELVCLADAEHPHISPEEARQREGSPPGMAKSCSKARAATSSRVRFATRMRPRRTRVSNNEMATGCWPSLISLERTCG